MNKTIHTDTLPILENLRPQIRTALQTMIKEELAILLHGAIRDPDLGVVIPRDFRDESTYTVARVQQKAKVKANGAEVVACRLCPNPARAKGLCSAHYQSERRKQVQRKKKKAKSTGK